MKARIKYKADELPDGLITGWQKIADFLDVPLRTAKHYGYVYHMPYYKLPGGVSIIPEEVLIWVREFSKRVKGDK